MLSRDFLVEKFIYKFNNRGDTISLEKLIRDNEHKFTQTDYVIANEILQRGLAYSLTINEFAGICYTSRTSVLRFAKKLGFNGYNDLKYYILNEKIDIVTSTSSKKDLKLEQTYQKLETSKRAFIYGNGAYENIIKDSIKRFLFDVGILAESYAGAEEIVAFDKKMLEDSLVIIVDFSNDKRSEELMFQIASINCGKIIIGSEYRSMTKSDYNIFLKEENRKLRLISPYILELEKFFTGFIERHSHDINEFN
ncbi:MurR/RpiR family transcriptional regulator [Anaerococcus tetradius]|uniref:Transcriptional regulator, RpiR family n=1 Tax=Anaerococcus tetradius TaxID=33036 RepID=A0A133KFF8_9FIRM|nr:MurR/RpiR family transcriptional regulator [Anaerococcus tetradius]KWZ78240.1 transcriptional regulator, RpiR family [Anaerococcus tetradius]